MTDRFKGLTVVLDHDIRDDDAECILNAIRMIKGVRDVKGVVANAEDYIVRQRLRHELGEKIMAILYPERLT